MSKLIAFNLWLKQRRKALGLGHKTQRPDFTPADRTYAVLVWSSRPLFRRKGSDGHSVRLVRRLNPYDSVDQREHSLSPVEREDYNHLADATRIHLGADLFDAAWEAGRTSPFEATVEEAVSIMETVLAFQDQATAEA